MIPENSKLAGSTSGVFIWQRQSLENLDVLDESKIPSLARDTVQANPFLCPTLTFLKTSFGAGQTDENGQIACGISFLSAGVREELDEPRHLFWKNPPCARASTECVDYRNKLTKAIYDAGGKIIASCRFA